MAFPITPLTTLKSIHLPAMSTSNNSSRRPVERILGRVGARPRTSSGSGGLEQLSPSRGSLTTEHPLPVTPPPTPPPPAPSPSCTQAGRLPEGPTQGGWVGTDRPWAHSLALWVRKDYVTGPTCHHLQVTLGSLRVLSSGLRSI